MDSEFYEIPAETADAIESASRVVCIGTTSVRAVETWARTGDRSGRTDLFITPGFRFQRADVMVTNFHLPRSTLLLLVSAFSGESTWQMAYGEAVRREYRFYSYGDAMLIQLPPTC